MSDCLQQCSVSNGLMLPDNLHVTQLYPSYVCKSDDCVSSDNFI